MSTEKKFWNIWRKLWLWSCGIVTLFLIIKGLQAKGPGAGAVVFVLPIYIGIFAATTYGIGALVAFLIKFFTKSKD